MKFGKVAKITSTIAAVAVVIATAATVTAYAVNANSDIASVTANPPAESITASTTAALLAETTPASTTIAKTTKKEVKEDVVEDLTIYIVSKAAADTHKKTIANNLKQYADYKIVYDAEKFTLSYDGDSVCYLEDVIKGGKTNIYTFDNAAKPALYLSIVRGENGEISGVKKISRHETVSELNTTKNITILGIPKFGELEFDGFDLNLWDGIRTNNITDFSEYESLGFVYDKKNDVLTYNDDVVSFLVDTFDKNSIKLYTNCTDGKGKHITIVEKDGERKVVSNDWTNFLDGFEGFGGFNGSGIWAMKDNDARLVGFEIVTPDMTEYEAFGLVSDTEKETITFNGKNVASVDDTDNGGLLIFANGSTVNGAIGVDVIRDSDGKITKIVENDHVKINSNGKMTAEERAALKESLEKMREGLRDWASDFKNWGDNICINSGFAVFDWDDDDCDEDCDDEDWDDDWDNDWCDWDNMNFWDGDYWCFNDED